MLNRDLEGRGAPSMEVKGIARVGAKTKELVHRLRPGDIAIIDHRDLDEVAADSLVAAKVKAVVNAADSISGRYPCQGPLLLLKHAVPLFDQAGAAVMSIPDGTSIVIKENELFGPHGWVANVVPRLLPEVQAAMADARRHWEPAVLEFVDNTLAYAEQEKQYFVGDIALPELETQMRDRQVLVVVRGLNYREDLQAISSYIREMQPVLIGVDGGADALLEQGYRPDIIIGDMDSITDKALDCGAEMIVHAYMDGRAPGAGRLDDKHVAYKLIRAPGTSEDLALVIAYQLGAQLIVAVGTHSNIVDFLEKGRPGMASTFLVRLKVGSLLVDAKGVSRLYQNRRQRSFFLHVVIAALVPITLIGLLSNDMRQLLRLLILSVRVSLGF
jgi:uncharacterized membrane-anchored protein